MIFFCPSLEKLRLSSAWQRRLPLLVILVCTACVSDCQAQKGAIYDLAGIKYEYLRPDTERKSPLVIFVPGFTQHNRTPEFEILKDFYRRRGFAVLIMNPPCHGEESTSGRSFRWGEREVDDLQLLADSLQLWQSHAEIHLLGFSIGAKTVLRFAAREDVRQRIRSVVAVATPYRVGDINFRPSTDLAILGSALKANVHALKRAGLGRILHMVFVGMPAAMLVNRATPANEIADITAPVLLLHSSGDWLTRSFHTKRLFQRAADSQHISAFALNSTLHAEDLLTRGGPELRESVLAVLATWLKVVSNSPLPSNKTEFNTAVQESLVEKPLLDSLQFPVTRISMMSSPTLFCANSGFWTTAADYNHSPFAVNMAYRASGNAFASYFVTLGSTSLKSNFLKRPALAFSFTQNGRDVSQPRLQLSLSPQVGSFIWLRRLTYVQDLHQTNRRIFSADLAFLVSDFQLNYGHMVDGSKDWQLAWNFPLFSNPCNSYFIGLGWQSFLTEVPPSVFRNSLSCYLTLGPGARIFQSRVRAILRYEQDGLWPIKTERIFSLGLSWNVKEK